MSLSASRILGWDPVENASLVPWMTLVGGLHVMLIYKSREEALLSYFSIYSTFFFILYSTFLTRSGILGNSSVHASRSWNDRTNWLSTCFSFWVFRWIIVFEPNDLKRKIRRRAFILA